MESRPTHEEIARLAYQLWEERGRPEGSPELDWERAEAALQIESTSLMQTPVERDETMAEARLAEERNGSESSDAPAPAARKRRASKSVTAQKNTRIQ